MKNLSDAVRIRQARTDIGYLLGVLRAWLDGEIPDGPVSRETIASLTEMAQTRLDGLRLVEQMLATPRLVEMRELVSADMGSAYAKGPAMTMARDELTL